MLYLGVEGVNNVGDACHTRTMSVLKACMHACMAWGGWGAHACWCSLVGQPNVGVSRAWEVAGMFRYAGDVRQTTQYIYIRMPPGMYQRERRHLPTLNNEHRMA